MTNGRDSSGGYLTGNESERLWDEEEEDAFISAQVDDDEDDDSYPNPEGPIESVWARAFAVAAEIVANSRAIARVHGLTTFNPNDPPIEELKTRSETLADERSELEHQMRMRGFPPKGWSPPPAAPPPPTAAPSHSASASRSWSPAEVLRPHLSDDGYQHYEWIDRGVLQEEIARRLGISQEAVSKREKKLRTRIDTIYIEATGRPYHWMPIPKPQGGRRRKS